MLESNGETEVDNCGELRHSATEMWLSPIEGLMGMVSDSPFEEKRVRIRKGVRLQMSCGYCFWVGKGQQEANQFGWFPHFETQSFGALGSARTLVTMMLAGRPGFTPQQRSHDGGLISQSDGVSRVLSLGTPRFGLKGKPKGEPATWGERPTRALPDIGNPLGRDPT